MSRFVVETLHLKLALKTISASMQFSDDNRIQLVI